MDKLLFLPQHKALAKKVADHVFDEYVDFQVIAIGGKSGVGKTEVAHISRDYLCDRGKICYVLSLDNFFLIGHEKRREKSLDQVGKEEIDWRRLWNSVENITNAKMCNVLIIEGLYALYYISYDTGFYISQSYDDSYGFRKDRGKENPDCMFRQKVLHKEAIDVRASKEKADMVLTYE